MSSTGASSSSTKSLTLTPAPEFRTRKNSPGASCSSSSTNSWNSMTSPGFRPRKNSPGASSSSSLPNPWTYNVFLSFRGDDTRFNFTDHLHCQLVRYGIATFIDDELRRGEEISPALVKAIEGSEMAIIVFSENYASSTWCLDELVKILECRELNRQRVCPIFYKVNPSDVRNQRGNFGRALADHAFKFNDNMEKVERWRTALTEAANLSGWHFSDGHESVFIEGVVREVSEVFSGNRGLHVAFNPVGVHRRARDVEELIGVGENDVRAVGIWGPAGIGKTTIAKEVYNMIYRNFEASCFLANVGESSTRHGLVEQQNFLLSNILRRNGVRVTNVDEGINVMKERLSHKKILLILDDVTDVAQLNIFAARPDWFGSGSRVIITTRDSRLLTAHQVNLIYKVEELDRHESLELLSWTAFQQSRVSDDYAKVADAVVNLAQGFPLVLEVFGSNLCHKTTRQWQLAIDRFRIIPSQDIQKFLRRSYDGLEVQERGIFLDIACFFKGGKMSSAIQILETRGMNARLSIEALAQKALLSVDEDDKIQMHDLLQQMGKEIVRQESPREPGRRSRLWDHCAVDHVLTENSGTDQIEGIMLDFPEDSGEIHLNDESFLKMKNLRVLKFRGAHISGEVSYLPNTLRVLDWHGFPSQSLPSNFYPKKLVVLNMCRSGVSYLWKDLKNLEHLKFLNLKYCGFLTETPNLSGMPNLEVLNLSHCKSLVEVHHSVGFLDKLVKLKVTGCSHLKLFPTMFKLRSLKSIDFEDCSRLEKFPEIVEQMEALTWMNLSGTAIEEVPSSIGYLTNLEELHLERCGNLKNISCSIFELQHLRRGFLSKCTKLTFPELRGNSDALAVPKLRKFEMGGCNLSSSNFLATLDCKFTLEKLDLSGSNFVDLAGCISKFINLLELNLHGCARLREIPELPPKVEFVDAGDCVSLCSFSILSRILEFKEAQMIPWLDLSNCQKLCDNLVHTAKMQNILMNQVALFSHFLSSQRSAFEVVFPGSKVPKWFSCSKDLKDLDKCEFSIEIPRNFNWDNKGLAFCVAVEFIHNSSVICSLKAKILINKVCIYERDIYLDSTHIQSNHVWMYYTPFLAMMSRIRHFNHVDTCGVSFVRTSRGSVCLKSCGVHIVKSQKKDISVEVYHEDTRSFGEDVGPVVMRGVDYDVDHEDSEEEYFSFDNEEDNHQEPTNSREAEGLLHSFQRLTKLAGPSLPFGATIMLVSILSWLLSAWFHG